MCPSWSLPHAKSACTHSWCSLRMASRAATRLLRLKGLCQHLQQHFHWNHIYHPYTGANWMMMRICQSTLGRLSIMKIKAMKIDRRIQSVRGKQSAQNYHDTFIVGLVACVNRAPRAATSATCESAAARRCSTATSTSTSWALHASAPAKLPARSALVLCRVARSSAQALLAGLCLCLEPAHVRLKAGSCTSSPVLSPAPHSAAAPPAAGPSALWPAGENLAQLPAARGVLSHNTAAATGVQQLRGLSLRSEQH